MTEKKTFRPGLLAVLFILFACAAALGANRVVTPPSHEVILNTASQIASRAKGTPDEQAQLEKTILGVIHATGTYSAIAIHSAASHPSLASARGQPGLASAQAKDANAVLYAITHAAKLDADKQRVVGRLTAQQVTQDVLNVFDTKAEASLSVMVAATEETIHAIDMRIAQLHEWSEFGDGDFARRVWIGGFGLWHERNADGIYRGYNYKSGGIILGYDHKVDSLVFGGAATYSKGRLNVDFSPDENRIESYGLSAYADLRHESGVMAGIAGGYLYSDNSYRSLIYAAGQELKKDFASYSYWLSGKMGYVFELESIRIAPSIGLRWQRSFNEKHKAKLAGNTFSIHEKLSATSLTTPINVAVTHGRKIGDEGYLTYGLQIGYAYDFLDRAATGSMAFIGQPSFTLRGVRLERHQWNTGATMRYQTGRYEFGLQYRFDVRKNLTGHALMGNFGVHF